MKKYIAVLLLLVSISGFSQESNSVEDNYKAYFQLPRETIFLHLNKTTLIAGEDLWFKAYIYDRHQSLPSKTSTNVYVSVYNDKGEKVKDDLWLAINGGAKGNIAIDSTFTSGDYYVKATTNWMKNFKEDDAFIQKIQVIGEEEQKTVSDQISHQKFDLQFLPEGGHIVMNTENTIGFKILNPKGKGILIEGIIVDEENNEITTFKSNRFGIGKFAISPIPSKTYRAIVKLRNGYTIEQNLPNIETNGIAININNLTPNKLFITLRTNPNTLSQIADDLYKIHIHKNGNLKTLSFAFNDKTQKSFTIPKSELHEGINTITVFDKNNNPVVERLIYNPILSKSASVLINKVKSDTDSITFSIYSLGSKNVDQLTNLSISILPESTQSYNPEHSILSANYLKPYVKGHVEQPFYYFFEPNRKTAYDLDVLLLTQGWSRYEWNSIFNHTPQVRYDFENGITLSGRIYNTPDADSLYFHSTVNQKSKTIAIEKDKTFSIKNLFPYKDEMLLFSYISADGSLKKPSMNINNTAHQSDKFIDIEPFKKREYKTPKEEFVSSFKIDDFFVQSKDIVKLDEVNIVTKKKKTDDKGYSMNDVSFRNNYQNITQREINNFPTVLEYIRYRGFIVNRSSQFRGLRILTQQVTSINASQSPAIFIDDIPLADNDYLIGLKTEDVEGIFVDKFGFGAGIVGANGVIRIYSRRTPLKNSRNKSKPYAYMSESKIGFSKPKRFYRPTYTSYRRELFKQFGVIKWLPNVFLKDGKSELFKIVNTKQPITFFIEGYDSNGRLVSETITIDPDSNVNK